MNSDKYPEWKARIETGLKLAEERRRLREQFAAAALTGLLASMQKNVFADEVACHAYEVADAMLRARDAEVK